MRFKKVRPEVRSATPKRRLAVEGLEARQMLAAGNAFSELYGMVAADFATQGFDIAISASSFNLAGGTTQIGMRVRAVDGSTIDPAVATIRTAAGSTVAPKLAKSDVAGANDSLAILDLAAGDYHIDVTAEHGTTGGYVVELTLIGDGDRDLKVTAADVNALRQRFGAKLGDGAYIPEMDIDADGRISSLDLSWAVKNNGDTTSRRIEAGRTVFWDGGAGDGNWFSRLNWTGDQLPTGADQAIVGVSTLVALNGVATVGSLSLENGARLTHSTEYSDGLTLLVLDQVFIDETSSIDVGGRGHNGSAGPGRGYASHAGGSGGGYAGRGMSIPAAGGGASYGDFETPVELGSGGGGDYAGAGGGAIKIAIGGGLQLEGAIRANGSTGIHSSGGGSGGSILLIVEQSLSGSGVIAADGGDGQAGGGGGRVAVYFGQDDFDGQIVASGGNGYFGYGGAGTVYIKQNGSSVSTLIIDNQGHAGATTEFASAVQVIGDVAILGGAVVSTSGSLPLDLTIAGNLHIDATSRIDVGGRGYAAGTGPGMGYVHITGVGSGGGYGGLGAELPGVMPGGGSLPGGSTYGSITQPTDPGSGGGGGYGGAGGGVIRLVVGGDLTVDGAIRADGAVGINSSGGGSGGSIYVIANRIAGSGTFSASGGEGLGGGGGGRIALYRSDDDFSGILTVAGGSGWFPSGQVGTIYVSSL